MCFLSLRLLLCFLKPLPTIFIYQIKGSLKAESIIEEEELELDKQSPFMKLFTNQNHHW